jgi:hypothetical protein
MHQYLINDVGVQIVIHVVLLLSTQKEKRKEMYIFSTHLLSC